MKGICTKTGWEWKSREIDENYGKIYGSGGKWGELGGICRKLRQFVRNWLKMEIQGNCRKPSGNWSNMTENGAN